MTQLLSTSFRVPLPLSSLSSLCGIFTLLLSLTVTLTASASVGASSDAFNEGGVETLSSSHIVIAVTLAVVALVLLTLLVPGCMDCFNSEVSTDPNSHTDGPRWGGASAYTPSGGNNLESGFRTGSLVDINNPQHLPYSMVPTQIPSQSGFAGFDQGDTASRGFTGYNSSTAPAGDGGGPRNYNPLAEEPPPPYSEAAGGAR